MDVSILIFYNKPRRYLEQARESAYNQIFDGDFEVIEQKGDKNTAENLNEGIKKCSGKYIKWLCDDDMLDPFCIASLYNKFVHSDCDVVVSNAKNFDSRGNVTFYASFIPKTARDLAIDNTIHGGTVMYSKQILIDNPLNENLKFAEEYELHLRLLKNGYKFAYVPKVTYFYRIHSNQKSMQGGFKDSQAYIARKRYIRDNVVNGYL